MKAILTRILIAVMLLTTIAGVPTLAEGERETISVGSAFVFRDGFFDEDVVKVLKDALNVREITFETCPSSEAAFIELREATSFARRSHIWRRFLKITWR